MATYEELKRYLSQAGNPGELFNQVAAHRDGLAHPALAGRSSGDLAQLDRFAQFAEAAENTPAWAAPFMGTAQLGAAAANEGVKAVGGTDLLARLLAKTPGLSAYADQFKSAPSMSRPSLGNVTAAAKGYWAGLTGDY